MDAVRQARQTNFDIIFMDENMPGLSGSEAIAEIRRAEATAEQVHRARIISRSADADDVLIAARAHDAGADFVWSKMMQISTAEIIEVLAGASAFAPR